MNSSKLRFGICGLGFMGRSHFLRLHDHPHAEVVAVCDADEKRRRGEWGGALGNLDLVKTTGGRAPLDGIRAYATPEELVADRDVDVVLIALPTPLHAPIAIAALQASKHVLTEKPMAIRPGECNRMIAAAQGSQRTLMVAQIIRFWPQYEMIKHCIDEGRIGAVRSVYLLRLGSPPTYSYGNWLLDGSQSGGALLDLHVHDVDFAQYLLGVPDTLFAAGMFGNSGSVEHVVATYRYTDGRFAIIEGGWVPAPPQPFEMAITVYGERGTLTWSMTRGGDVRLHAPGAPPEAIPCPGDAVRNELDYFIDCVRAGRPVDRCPPESSRTSVVLAWLERRSIELGRQVDVSERLREAWAEG